ncbi:protein FAM227A [Ambystoma mexicanum]|uniref:protein FAM227A n=1 Tax=Ambystoma mexicanum TaxID=8296 RepID=UPI0037E86C7B
MMASINRLSSPMALYEEDLLNHPLKQEQLRDSVRRSVMEAPASFLIGSMGRVNEKIAKLEFQLRACNSDDMMHDTAMMPCTTKTDYQKLEDDCEHTGRMLCLHAKTRGKSREQDKSELQSFAQKYERSMHRMDSAKHLLSKKSSKKKLMAAPLLVEMYRFPGFLEDGLSLMPNRTAMSAIIKNVVAAHSVAHYKFCSPRDIYQFLSKPTVHDIVVDSFWWIFLHKYQPDPDSQALLFDRIAEKYVDLLHQCNNGNRWNAFMTDFPNVLSQMIYTMFCFSFPDSVVKFRTSEFRTFLCNTIWEWIAGLRPSPNISNNWGFDYLEPKKKEVELRNSGNNKEKKAAADTTVDAQLSSVSLSKWKCVPLQRMRSKAYQNTLSQELSKHSLDLSGPSRVHTRDDSGISRSSSLPAVLGKPLSLQTNGEAKLATQKQRKYFETRLKRVENESHPACLGPDFVYNLFNLNGHSPLLQHFLKRQDALSRTRNGMLVQRTEIEKPILCSAETYASVIHKSFKHLWQTERIIQALYSKRSRESAAFSRSQLSKKRDCLRKEKLILSNKSEIKRISQLLFPVSKDQDEGLPEEVEQALAAAHERS